MSRRSRSKPLPQEQPAAPALYEEDEDIGDDEADALLDEEAEVTRCVCGRDELTPLQTNAQLLQLLQLEYGIKVDLGLFIQCDKCLVWQHGYCVGLFMNDDVPDKYWCEMCRPEMHVVVEELATGSRPSRTLYKPVNEKRRALLNWTGGRHRADRERSSAVKHEVAAENHLDARGSGSGAGAGAGAGTGAGTSSGGAAPDDGTVGEQSEGTATVRKDRRHAEGYDEQLEKALRESAKESGVPLSDIEGRTSRKRRAASGKEESSGGEDDKNTTTAAGGLRKLSPDLLLPASTSSRVGSPTKRRRGVAAAGADSKPVVSSDNDDRAAHSQDTNASSATSAPTTAGTSGGSSSTGTKGRGRGKSKAGTPAANSAPAPTKEELTSQPSKPRFVNPKSSIYELRKRTGAILEWLGRLQLELEEEKSHKVELFLYHENDNEAKREQPDITGKYDHNLRLMEQLTEKILNWEQKFGKYAP